MENHLPPTVSINGSAIRRIRETKKLTQLYVAKVVGVTTDTISRWENNRYPSIKRDNVLALAEALEVAVDELLKVDESAENLLEEEPAQQSPMKWLLLAAVLCAALIWIFVAFTDRAPEKMEVLAERMLPRYAAPGSVIPVWVKTDPALRNRGYIVREHFPAGWKLIEASPPASSLDNVQGTARWIIKPGEKRDRIVYLVKVARTSEMGSQQQFVGEVVVKGDTQGGVAKVGGNAQMEIAGFLWPDANGDSIVDDGEMLAASDVFDDMKGVHLDWNFLENIWDAGQYQWVQKKARFVPVKKEVQAAGKQ